MKITASHLLSVIWAGAGTFIYNYQTLIAGVLAIGAAWYAGAPVWRQLKDSNLQTRIMHRETLAMRLREAEERAVRVAKAIDDPLWKAQDVTSDPAGEPIEISEHDAHGVEQMILGRLDWYLTTLVGTEDAAVEEAKAALKAALKDLTDTLSDVHWPAHNDQSGENYSMTDEEWAEVLQKAEDGKKLATAKVSAAWKANRALKDAQQASIDGLRRQIAALDQSIARNT
ncbi:hypothetical protein [Sphingomonas sp. Root241]|uniref:hypothetical protein n=1 Tax=Sphingomonas sp. Root241 TaxID=1736501 RepID=UPI000B310DC0|nr:hypothetical protein [Sphingomonas sp. Root241]